MEFKRFLGTFIISIIFLTNCKKESSNKISEVPSIEFVSVSSQSIKANKDSLSIIFNYKDGNGDLGENNSDVRNLFVTDNRNNVTYQYRIKQLAPDNESIAIQGELAVVINTVPLLNADSLPEQVIYSLYIKDRAGNQSNSVSTTAISVSH